MKGAIKRGFLAETILKAADEEVEKASASSSSTLLAEKDVPEVKERPITPEDELISMETLRPSPVQWPERCKCRKREHEEIGAIFNAYLYFRLLQFPEWTSSSP